MCLRRGIQRLRNNIVLPISFVLGNFVMALIVGSIFYNLDDSTKDLSSRGVFIFFAVLLNAFMSAFEVRITPFWIRDSSYSHKIDPHNLEPKTNCRKAISVRILSPLRRSNIRHALRYANEIGDIYTVQCYFVLHGELEKNGCCVFHILALRLCLFDDYVYVLPVCRIHGSHSHPGYGPFRCDHDCVYNVCWVCDTGELYAALAEVGGVYQPYCVCFRESYDQRGKHFSGLI